MANLDLDVENITDEDCVDCDIGYDCCDDSCLARLLIAPCGAIDRDTGLVLNNDYSQFCVPSSITAMTPTWVYGIREKNYKNSCFFETRRGRRRFTLSITADKCQSDYGNSLLRESCPVDFIYIDNAQNFNGDFQINEQTTEMIWGRIIGGDVSGDLPDDECQSFSRDFQTTGKFWRTKPEALQPNAG